MDLNELSKNPEQIKGLINLLQGLLQLSDTKQNDQEDVSIEGIAESKPNSKIKTRGGSKKKSSDYVNKFDKMAEARMHKEDAAIDKKLCVNPPVARAREFEMIDVVCRICGRKETVNPVLVVDNPSRYKCNNCSTQAG